MRESSFNKGIYVENGQNVVLGFGCGFCAEHEWGINRLSSTLGVSDDPNVFGVERRRVSKTNFVRWAEFGVKDPDRPRAKKPLIVQGLYVSQYEMEGLPYDLTVLPVKYRTKPEHNLMCAWDGGEFCAMSSDPDTIAKLREFYAALMAKDAAIWLAGRGKNPFGRSGLMIGIISRIAEENLKLMEQADREAVTSA